MPDSQLLGRTALLLTVAEPVRFDRALLEAARHQAPALSRHALKQHLAERRSITLREVETGRKLQVNASFPLRPGTYEVDEPTLLKLIADQAHPPQARPEPRGCFLPIVYEDASLLVLDKAPGVPTLPQSARETGTAVNAALAHCPALSEVGKAGLEPGLLHRLDTLTSGLLAFAKTPEAYAQLKHLWSSGKVAKIYCARVSASSKRAPLALHPGLEIDHPLCADPKSKKRMRPFSPSLQAQGARPLSAHTQVLEVQEVHPGVLEVTVRITTGVRHQIRAHLASLGWPIVGDPLYGGSAAPPGERALYLHATQLNLPGPICLKSPKPWK